MFPNLFRNRRSDAKITSKFYIVKTVNNRESFETSKKTKKQWKKINRKIA